MRRPLLAAALFAASCREYALFEHDRSSEQARPSGGEAGVDLSEVGGGASAGTFGGMPTQRGREGGTAGQPGVLVDGGAGGAEGGSANASAPPTVLGTVLIHADGVDCAGTLQSNAWVLTASHCIPRGANPASIKVALGSDRTNPRDVVEVAEIDRFGEEERDLALLRLARPFTIGGSNADYRRPFYPSKTGDLLDAPLYCLGWDMNPNPGAAGTTQAELLQVVEIEAESADIEGKGATYWLQNATLADDPGTDRITQAADAGGGCFVSLGDEWHQAAVQLESSFWDPEGVPSRNAWARASPLMDLATRQWLLRTMLGHAAVPGIVPSRGLGAMVDRDDAIVLLWIDAAGALFRAPLHDLANVESLGSPEGVEFVKQRPAGALFRDQVLIAAYGSDGQLWYRLLGGESSTPWTVIDSAPAPTSGAALVNVAGIVHLFALGADAELRHSTFVGYWQSWEYLDGACAGTPSASSYGAARIDTAAWCADGRVWSRVYDTGQWLDWVSLGVAASAQPVVIDLNGRANHYFWRSPSGRLLTTSYNSGWLSEWLDMGISSGENLTGVARTGGSYDLFFSGEGSDVTHIWWPR